MPLQKRVDPNDYDINLNSEDEQHLIIESSSEAAIEISLARFIK